MENIISALALELGQKEEYVANVVTMLDEGNTIPFIARYRKEATGGLSDEILRDLAYRILNRKLFKEYDMFKDLDEQHIINLMHVNATAVMRLIHHFYDKIQSQEDFYCGVMVSIAGFMSSPFFSVYGASKAALKIFIESVNVELEKGGSANRILNVSPGSIKGTSFNHGETDLAQTTVLANEIIRNLETKNDLFIPQYEEVFKHVLARYQADFREEGRHSYEYKINSGRIK